VVLRPSRRPDPARAGTAGVVGRVALLTVPPAVFAVLWLAPLARGGLAAVAAAVTALAALQLHRALARVRRAEAGRAHNDAGVRALADASTEAIVFHRDGAVVHINPAARRMFRPGGQPATLADLFADPSVVPAASAAEVTSAERELTTVAGTTVSAEISTGLLELDGAPVAIVILRDVSDRRQLRERLVTTERLVSLGTLAAGVAHEINNPLAVVLWNLELLRDELAAAGAGAETRTMVAEAMDAGERVRGIVADMRTLSRTPGHRNGAVDIVRVVDRAVQIAGGTIKHRARIVRDYQTVPTVLADEARLVQVVINLLTNAADAIPAERGQGTITVGTRVDAGGDVVAWVRDDGVGIPAELQARVFDPFFTTKEVGVGTGLGLSISHNLVTSMQGRLLIDSEPGRGTTVSVVLHPAPSAAPGKRVSEPPPRVRARSRARILIVDDEPAIGAVASRLLGRVHDVVAVASGKAALARLDDGERFDLVLCDLLMPEMTGLDLHARLRADYPDQAARVVFMTGGVGQESRDAAARLSATVLDKPLSARILAAFVDEFLSQRQERAA
jgi:two-component system cell cycle sensor histidine kinase/response regulator CckA